MAQNSLVKSAATVRTLAISEPITSLSGIMVWTASYRYCCVRLSFVSLACGWAEGFDIKILNHINFLSPSPSV